MGAGLGLLRLSPDAFWAMTPRELDSALAWWRPKAGPSPGRGGLAALMAAFPDTRSNDDG